MFYPLHLFRFHTFVLVILQSQGEKILGKVTVFDCAKTQIFVFDVTSPIHFQPVRIPQIIPTLLISANLNRGSSVSNGSYFGREFEPWEVANSYFAMGNHFTGHCSNVYIFASTSIESFHLSNILLFKKLARPHHDHFYHILTSEKIFPNSAKTISRFRYLNFQNSANFKFERPALSPQNLLGGKSILVVTISAPEKIRFENNADGTLRSGEGVYYEMLKAISHLRNFTFSITLGSGASGRKLKDGTWDGAVGDIFYGRVNLGVMVGTSASRDGVIDYSATMDRYTRIFYTAIPLRGISWRAIYVPFDLTLWILLAATTMIFIVVLYLLNITAKHFNRDVEMFSKVKTNRRSDELSVTKLSLNIDELPNLEAVRIAESETENFDIRDIIGGDRTRYAVADLIGDIFKILVEQDTSILQWNSWRLRYLLFIWVYFSLLIGTAYRSKLMASLTQPEPLESPPKSHPELAVSDYTLYFRYYGGAVYQYMAQSRSPVHRRIFSRMYLVNTSADCVTLALLQPKSACLDYISAGDYAISSNTSLNFSQTRKLFLKSVDSDFYIGVTWAFPKGSPLTNEFTNPILRLLGSGLHGRWIDWDQSRQKIHGSRWLKATQEAVALRNKIVHIFAATETSSRKLGLDSFYGLALMVASEIVIAIAAFVIESLNASASHIVGSKNMFYNMVANLVRKVTIPEAVVPLPLAT